MLLWAGVNEYGVTIPYFLDTIVNAEDNLELLQELHITSDED